MHVDLTDKDLITIFRIEVFKLLTLSFKAIFIALIWLAYPIVTRIYAINYQLIITILSGLLTIVACICMLQLIYVQSKVCKDIYDKKFKAYDLKILDIELGKNRIMTINCVDAQDNKYIIQKEFDLITKEINKENNLLVLELDRNNKKLAYTKEEFDIYE